MEHSKHHQKEKERRKVTEARSALDTFFRVFLSGTSSKERFLRKVADLGVTVDTDIRGPICVIASRRDNLAARPTWMKEVARCRNGN